MMEEIPRLEKKNCVLCHEELDVNQPSTWGECKCGCRFYLTQPGEKQVKIFCPVCDQKLSLGSETFDHKIACACETYFFVSDAVKQESLAGVDEAIKSHEESSESLTITPPSKFETQHLSLSRLTILCR